jgi:AraC-like DNA-binding protein
MFHDSLSQMLDRSSGAADRVAPDALSDVLQDLRLSGASYCRTDLRAPWGLKIPAQEGAIFHFVAEGSGWLQTAARKVVRLEARDVVLLPHGAGHIVVDQPGSPTRALRDVDRERLGTTTYRLRAGGTGTHTLLLCCAVRFDEPSVHPLIELMPSVLHVKGAGHKDESLVPLLEAMAKELADQRVGAATVMTRLADIVIARVVRAWAEARPTDARGWLGAIRDPQIGRALAGFHRQPRAPWSLVSLAAAAHLSRSTFSERFTAVMGVSPARYVARWRMHLAATWLKSERLTVAEVATRLGYESEASFSRAFKRFMGAPPSTFRRREGAETRRWSPTIVVSGGGGDPY